MKKNFVLTILLIVYASVARTQISNHPTHFTESYTDFTERQATPHCLPEDFPTFGQPTPKSEQA